MAVGFTLIELLVVISILVVLSVAVVLVLNPAELIKQGRDSTRISDLAALRSAISLYLADVTNPFLAGPATACTAVATSTCTSGTASPFATINTCVTNTSTTVDGNGWVRVPLNGVTTGSPLPRLPMDPNNGGTCAAGNCFYAYACSSTVQYKLTAHMESSKYKSGGSGHVEDNDGGTSSTLYEVGSLLSL